MGGLFQKPSMPAIVQQAPPPVPAPTPVAPLPSVDDTAVQQARDLNRANLLQRSGRRSTILTSPQTRAPAAASDSYASAKFGS